MSFIKHILLFYLIITFVGSVILMLPFSHKVQISYIDALFTSASAFSDTGLVTMTTSTTWTMFGQAVIAILILIGGVGWFALKVFIFNIIFNRPISLTTRIALSAERGNIHIGDTREIIKISIITIFIIMTISGLILSLHFYFSDTFFDVSEKTNDTGINPYGDWATSIRYGIFHSISAINNAGFDIIGKYSISPYFNDYFVQIIFIILFIVGGIGYPVIYDVYIFFKNKKQGIPFRFSLFTKTSTITYIFISIIGISITFLIEVNAITTKSPENSDVINQTFWSSKTLMFDNYTDNSKGQILTTGNKTMALIFNTLSTRNAGFSTINFHQLTSATLTIHAIMMFIGSAPSSTAGGIRTTTFAIIILSFWSKVRGRPSVQAFKRTIKPQTVWNAYIVTTVSIFLIIISTLVASSSFEVMGGEILFGSNYSPKISSGRYDYLDIFFEVSSAFGTTGLSTGLTSQLNVVSKMLLILIMFIGQLGISSTIFSLGYTKKTLKHYKFIEEDLTIG